MVKDEWEFLQPWHAALRGALAGRNETAGDFKLWLKFIRSSSSCGRVEHQRFSLRVRRDSAAARLRQLGEAIELFTLLSFVNNRAFAELMIKSTGRSDTVIETHLYCPSWDLQVIGTTSSNDPAGTSTPVTWAMLLGFPPEYSEYSPEFHAAVQRLKSLEPKESVKVNFQSRILWSCKFQDSKVHGRQELGEGVGGVSKVSTEFRNLLGLEAPAVAQLRLTREKAALLDVWRGTPPVPESSDVWATMAAPSTFMEVAAALARTPTSRLTLDLYREVWVADPSQATINALTTLVCGRSFCTLASAGGSTSVTSRADCGGIGVLCHSVSDEVFVATLSAVAKISPETQLEDVHLDSMDFKRWGWLVYALHCRASDERRNADHYAVLDLAITETALTKADMSAIIAALETGYPQTSRRGDRVYGFVDVDEGAVLGFSELLDYSGNALVGSCNFRCRASYDKVANGGAVDVVVRGMGFAQRDSAIQFASHPIQRNFVWTRTEFVRG